MIIIRFFIKVFGAIFAIKGRFSSAYAKYRTYGTVGKMLLLLFDTFLACFACGFMLWLAPAAADAGIGYVILVIIGGLAMIPIIFEKLFRDSIAAFRTFVIRKVKKVVEKKANELEQDIKEKLDDDQTLEHKSTEVDAVEVDPNVPKTGRWLDLVLGFVFLFLAFASIGITIYGITIIVNNS